MTIEDILDRYATADEIVYVRQDTDDHGAPYTDYSDGQALSDMEWLFDEIERLRTDNKELQEQIRNICDQESINA